MSSVGDTLRGLFTRESSRETSSTCPIYDPGFFANITFKCDACGTEFWESDDTEHLECYHCGHVHAGTADDMPDVVRAKCWQCNTISTDISGFRAANIRFDCPKCDFVWESDRY